MGASLVLLITSVDSQAVAKSLAHAMIQEQLAVCVQISASTTSIYPWKGKIESAEEYSLAIKIVTEKLDDAIAWLHEHHPYEIPEVLWWPVHASDAYAHWAHTSLDMR